jgi:predicted aspartyl protease
LRYLGTQRNLYQTLGAARATIPFELSNNRPIINVRINGSKTPLRFVVDTGSGMCVLSATAAARLNIKPVAQGGLARAVGGGGRFEIVYAFLSSLQMEEVRIENVPIYIRQFHNTQEAVDGYIGLSVLAKYLASIDYGARQMTLVRHTERPAAPRPAEADTIVPSNSNSILSNDEAAASVAMLATTPNNTLTPGPKVTPALPAGANVTYEFPIRSTSSGFWSSAVFLDGVEKPLNFIVDTGASISVVSADLARTEELARYEQKRRIKIFGAAGISEDVMTLIVPRLTMGGYTHTNLSAAVLDMSAINETSGFEQTGIIGGNVLSRFRVTFDFLRGLVRLDPLTTRPAPALTPSDANMTPASSGATR